MDHLVRTPLLLELSHSSAQHLKPRGAAKARTRRQSRTSASMPTAGGESNMARRVKERRRLEQARDRRPGISRRRAQDDYKSRRKHAHHGHLDNVRKNPNAKTKTAARGNPQAKSKTELRLSPSKQKHRPPIASRMPPIFPRGSMLGRNRI